MTLQIKASEELNTSIDTVLSIATERQNLQTTSYPRLNDIVKKEIRAHNFIATENPYLLKCDKENFPSRNGSSPSKSLKSDSLDQRRTRMHSHSEAQLNSPTAALTNRIPLQFGDIDTLPTENSANIDDSYLIQDSHIIHRSKDYILKPLLALDSSQVKLDTVKNGLKENILSRELLVTPEILSWKEMINLQPREPISVNKGDYTSQIDNSLKVTLNKPPTLHFKKQTAVKSGFLSQTMNKGSSNKSNEKAYLSHVPKPPLRRLSSSLLNQSGHVEQASEMASIASESSHKDASNTNRMDSRLAAAKHSSSNIKQSQNRFKLKGLMRSKSINYTKKVNRRKYPQTCLGRDLRSLDNCIGAVGQIEDSVVVLEQFCSSNELPPDIEYRLQMSYVDAVVMSARSHHESMIRSSIHTPSRKKCYSRVSPFNESKNLSQHFPDRLADSFQKNPRSQLWESEALLANDIGNNSRITFKGLDVSFQQSNCMNDSYFEKKTPRDFSKFLGLEIERGSVLSEPWSNLAYINNIEFPEKEDLNAINEDVFQRNSISRVVNENFSSGQNPQSEEAHGSIARKKSCDNPSELLREKSQPSSRYQKVEFLVPKGENLPQIEESKNEILDTESKDKTPISFRGGLLSPKEITKNPIKDQNGQRETFSWHSKLSQKNLNIDSPKINEIEEFVTPKYNEPVDSELLLIRKNGEKPPIQINETERSTENNLFSTNKGCATVSYAERHNGVNFQETQERNQVPIKFPPATTPVRKSSDNSNVLTFKLVNQVNSSEKIPSKELVSMGKHQDAAEPQKVMSSFQEANQQDLMKSKVSKSGDLGHNIRGKIKTISTAGKLTKGDSSNGPIKTHKRAASSHSHSLTSKALSKTLNHLSLHGTILEELTPSQTEQKNPNNSEQKVETANSMNLRSYGLIDSKKPSQLVRQSSLLLHSKPIGNATRNSKSKDRCKLAPTPSDFHRKPSQGKKEIESKQLTKTKGVVSPTYYIIPLLKTSQQ